MSYQGDIGVLDRTDMDDFADIFKAMQERGKTKDDTSKEHFRWQGAF
jgi:hypothetical protein